MNKTTSIFVGVLFSTLVLASCGSKKDEATPEAATSGQESTPPAPDAAPAPEAAEAPEGK